MRQDWNFTVRTGANGSAFGDRSPSDAINDLKEEGYTYFLFWIDRKDEQLRSAVDGDAGLVLEREFLNKRGNSVRLYRLEPVRH